MGEAVNGGWLNQQQLADALGCSSPYITKLRKTGRITYADEGSRVYDLEQVRSQLARTEDVRQVMAAQTRREQRGADVVDAPALPPANGDAIDDSEEPEYTGDAHQDYKIASAFEKREAARMARIERMRLEGSLGMIADMEREAYTEARIIRDLLLGALPTKLAPVLAPLDNVFEVEHTLREALRDALHDVVRQIDGSGEGVHVAG